MREKPSFFSACLIVRWKNKKVSLKIASQILLRNNHIRRWKVRTHLSPSELICVQIKNHRGKSRIKIARVWWRKQWPACRPRLFSFRLLRNFRFGLTRSSWRIAASHPVLRKMLVRSSNDCVKFITVDRNCASFYDLFYMSPNDESQSSRSQQTQ